ncbi:DUF6118 family protein [Phenylobacterium sp. J367]|uniref:DUF6118 family protein n=1 Tax=Phenylobacterium sp. J367 TaxID=2898435 RepID=UPI0021516D9C|nr:DUF6118 family protein [Phenylobacterium sp. J367]MCR5877296.1 DUF6118 family protein [Phenylobacterium sp. J367]
MSLQPDDAAADAFERLRTEVALLRRAVEGLAAEGGPEAVDYSPTLAELSDAIAEVGAQATALGERPVLALAPDQLGSLFQIAAAKVLARPVAELEREKIALARATDAVAAAHQASLARTRSWRRTAALLGCGAVVGLLLCSVLVGPLTRLLPSSWGVPERLAAATLDLPLAPAGERLLRRGEPEIWEALEIARALPAAERAALRGCLARPTETRRRTCTVKLGRS